MSVVSGHGIEIGALHNPVAVPVGARVTYVDRMTVDELRTHYPELADRVFVPVDIVTDAERLDAIGDATQDFVIANHVLEHLEDPIRALLNMCRVLKPHGVLWLAVPDKLKSFDIDRLTTTLAHVWRDFREDPETSRRQHYEEWTRIVNKVANETDARRQIEENIAARYSIHFHAWTEAAFRGFLDLVQSLLNGDVELFEKHDDEFVVVIRRNSGDVLRTPIEDFTPPQVDDFASMLDETLRPEPWSIESITVTDDAVEIAGWALAPGGNHGRVTFTVNGRRFTDVQYPLERPDIARMFWFKPGADRTGFRCRLSIARHELLVDGRAAFQFVDRALGKPINDHHTVFYPDDTRHKLDRAAREVSRRGPEDLAPDELHLVTTLGTLAACRAGWSRQEWQQWLDTGMRVEANRTFVSEAFVRREWFKEFEILDFIAGYIDNEQDLVVMRPRVSRSAKHGAVKT